MTPKRRFFRRPAKKELLATKQAKRIRRTSRLGRRLAEWPSQRWVGGAEIVGLAILSLANFFLLYPFFGQEDKTNVFSAPVVPLLANLFESFAPFAYGVRIWLLIFMLFFPLSFYYFVREISGRKLTGFLASLMVIVPTGFFLPLRIELGLLGQDGSHIASLTFIPLVCLLLLRFLRLGHFWQGVFAALGTVLVALSSPIGLAVLVTFMVVITFSEMLLGRGRLKILRFLMVLVLAAGLCSFWYNPRFSLLLLESSQGELMKRTFFNLLPISFFTIPLLGIFGFLLFENRPQLQPMFIAFFLTVAFGLFSLGAGVANPSPSRFLAAFGACLAFLASLAVVGLFDFWRLSAKKKRRFLAYGLVASCFVLVVILILTGRENLYQWSPSQVLGLASEKITGIWEIKEEISPAQNRVGYAITSLTALGAFLVKIRLGI